MEPNTYSPTWHAVFGTTQPEEVLAHEIAFIARVLPLPGHRAVLDVCCGAGRHLARLSALGYEVTGIERDPAVVQAARVAAPAAHVVEGDVSRLSELVQGPFDGIVCLWASFGYGPPEENAALLGAMAGLLRPGGRLVLDVYNRAFFEIHAGERTIERAGRSILDRTELAGDRLTSTVDYGSGIEDLFSWQVFTPAELEVLAGTLGLTPVLSCARFDGRVAPSPESARMQHVLALGPAREVRPRARHAAWLNQHPASRSR